MDASKKISFSFSKTTKKPELQSNKPKNEDNKVELIECLEGQAIKIKDAVEEVKAPLVIPMVESDQSLIERIKQAQEKSTKKEVKEEVEEKPDSELSIDELAARELLREAQNRDTISTSTTKVHTLPLSEEPLLFEGKEEPSLEDYESVPISQYGMAMLRGMGWKEGTAIGKNPSKLVKTDVPELRPKGLGLGANKIVTVQNKVLDKDGKELLLVKGAFAKIIAGAHKGNFCKVEGLDDENCRVIVKTANTNQILTLNEFVLIPITKEEYDIGSKVINNAKYEEFKELSDNRLKTEKDKEQANSVHREHKTTFEYPNEKIKTEILSDSDDENDYKRKYRKKLKIEKYKTVDVNNKEKHTYKGNETHSDYDSDDYKKYKKKSKREKCSDSSSDEQKRKKRKSKHKARHREHSSSGEDAKKHKKKKSKSKHRDSPDSNDGFKKKRSKNKR